MTELLPSSLIPTPIPFGSPGARNTGEVRLEREGALACIIIDNPPLNNISHAVRIGLLTAVRKIASDPEILAVVLRCEGRTFASGADLREVDMGMPPPHLPDVITELEALDRPVVAALHGYSLGGGMEIALGCSARVAAPGTRLGFPEATLGLLPGAGGTQRLPRLVGVKVALDLMLSGRQLQTDEALAISLIDQVASSDPVAPAATMALGLAACDNRPQRISERRAVVDSAIDSGCVPAGVDITLPASRNIVRCVRAAAELPFHEGMQLEASLFEELRLSEESRALRHLFFAERDVTRLGEVGRERAQRLAASWRAALDAASAPALSDRWLQVMHEAAAEALRSEPKATSAEVDVLAVREFGYPRHWGGPRFRAERGRAGDTLVPEASPAPESV